MGQGPGYLSRKGLCQIDQAHGDPALVHDISRKYEKGDRKKGEYGYPAEHPERRGRDSLGITKGRHDCSHGSHAEGYTDGDSCQQKNHKYDQNDQSCCYCSTHTFSSPFGSINCDASSPMLRIQYITMRTPAAGRMAYT